MRLQPKMALWPCTKKTRQTTVTLRCSLKLVKVATFKSRELHSIYESQRFMDIFAVMFAVTWHWMFFRNKKKWLRLVTFCLKTSTKTRPLAASKDINGRSRLIASHRDVSPCQIGLDRRRRQAARAGPVCQWPATANRMLVSSPQTYGRRPGLRWHSSSQRAAARLAATKARLRAAAIFWWRRRRPPQGFPSSRGMGASGPGAAREVAVTISAAARISESTARAGPSGQHRPARGRCPAPCCSHAVTQPSGVTTAAT